MLKQFTLFTLIIAASFSSFAQSNEDVLMKVGDTEVTVEEFKYIYEKNNGEKADYSKQSVDEYLDLYTNFKLKVEEAKAMRLDTVTSLKQELKGYRDQLATSFMLDKEVTDAVIEEVHNRKKYDIPVRHILRKVRRIDPQPKKDEAEKLLKTVKNEIAVGISFEEAVSSHSEDKGSQKTGGNIGYVTAMLPNGFYDLENAIFESKPGDVVGPVWSNLGCHLVKVGKKRPARGILKVAHLLVKVEKKDNPSIKLEEANKYYEALKKGADWNALVLKNSEDTKTREKDGELPIFGISTYEKAFEDAAHELKNVGDISKPVKTKSGYHIIKLLEKVPTETKEEVKKRLKSKISRYDRYNTKRKEFIANVQKTAKFSENTNALDAFKKSLSSDFYSYKWKVDETQPKETLMSFEDKTFTTLDFANYCKKNIRKRSGFDPEMNSLKEVVSIIYKDFVNDKTLEYAQSDLEAKYPAFNAIMREYREGILLFEATKMSVWDKANQDSVGLKSYYANHKNEYKFDERVKLGTYTLNTTNPKMVKKVTKCVKKRSAEKTLKRFNKKQKDLIAFEEETFDANNPALEGLELKKGSVSAPIVNEKKKTTTLKKVVSVEAPRVKTLEEARGYVVADYQDKLEKDWIKALQEKYDVVVFDEVLKKLVK